MNLYIYLAGILIIGFLLYVNKNLSDEISYQETELLQMQSSLKMAKEDNTKKLEAIEFKKSSDLKTSQEINEKRKGCENDEKAISIINIGVPDCLF